jgi:hypothetical protein
MIHLEINYVLKMLEQLLNKTYSPESEKKNDNLQILNENLKTKTSRCDKLYI